MLGIGYNRKCVMSMSDKRVVSTDNDNAAAMKFKECSKMIVRYINGGLRIENINTHKQYKFSKGLLWAILEINPGIEIEMRDVPRSYFQGIAIELEKFERRKAQGEKQLTEAFMNADELIVTRSKGNIYVVAAGTGERCLYSQRLLHAILDNKPDVKMRAVRVPRSVVRGIEIEAKRYKRMKGMN